MVPAGDYVWIGLEQAVLMTDVPLGQWTAGTRRWIVELEDGHVADAAVKQHLIWPFYDALVETSQRRVLRDSDDDPTPLVFVVDDRVPIETLVDFQYTAGRIQRSRTFLFSGTVADPRAVAIVAPPWCGVGDGINRFEADLSLSLRDGRLFPVGHAREAGAPPDGGSPSAARDPNELPIDVDGHGRCSLEWPREAEMLRKIQSELCRVSQGRPYQLMLDTCSPDMRTGELVRLLDTDLRPESCRTPIEISLLEPAGLDTSCARATKVMDLPAAFAAAEVREPG